MKHVTGLCVCVDYADKLAQSIDVWKSSLDRIVIITSPKDTATLDLVSQHNLETHVTEVFYTDGAKFNKGRAITEAFDRTVEPLEDWLLFFDADIAPPYNWRTLASRLVVEGNLYGCYRANPQGCVYGDPDIAGYFHLAHKSDENLAVRPIVNPNYYHAGNYDSDFQDRWPKSKRIRLPFTAIHYGEPGKNWCGVGNTHLVNEIHRQRELGKDWKTETINT